MVSRIEKIIASSNQLDKKQKNREIPMKPKTMTSRPIWARDWGSPINTESKAGKRVRDVVQLIEHLPITHKALYKLAAAVELTCDSNTMGAAGESEVQGRL